jgi:cell division protein FtsB
MSFLLTPGVTEAIPESEPQLQEAPKQDAQAPQQDAQPQQDKPQQQSHPQEDKPQQAQAKPNFLESAEAILNSYKKIKFMLPEAERPALEAITEDMRILVENYCGLLTDSSVFSQKLLRDLDAVKAELKETKARNAAYEKELWDFRQTTSANINKRQFSFYVMSAKSRAPTEAEWLLFNDTFTIDYKHINAKVYDWIDTNLKD